MAKSEINSFRVYVHRRQTDGKIFYVGKGKDERPFTKSGRSTHWRRIVAKYGYYVEIVLDWAPNSCCLSFEKALIFAIGKENLCNVTDGGEGAIGLVHGEESKLKMSERQKLTWKNPEYKKSRVGENHHMYGIPRTQEQKEHISKVHKGRIVSLETREKLRLASIGENNAMWGKQLSKEHKEKISLKLKGENHPLFGIPCTEERKEMIRKALKGRVVPQWVREKISKSQKGRIHSEETKEKLSQSIRKKTIYNFRNDDGREFSGIRLDFINEYNLDPSSVTKVVKNKEHSVKGWRLLSFKE